MSDLECETGGRLGAGRHHCRKCGRVFCGKCTQRSIAARLLRPDGRSGEDGGEKVRVCEHCYSEALGLPRKDAARDVAALPSPNHVRRTQ